MKIEEYEGLNIFQVPEELRGFEFRERDLFNGCLELTTSRFTAEDLLVPIQKLSVLTGKVILINEVLVYESEGVKASGPYFFNSAGLSSIGIFVLEGTPFSAYKFLMPYAGVVMYFSDEIIARVIYSTTSPKKVERVRINKLKACRAVITKTEKPDQGVKTESGNVIPFGGR